MPTDVGLTRLVADEVMSAKMGARRLVMEIEAARRRGAVSGEALDALERQARHVLEVIGDAKELADHLNKLQAAFETGMRLGVLKPTEHKRKKFQAAGLDLLVLGPIVHGESGDVSAG